MKPESRDGKIVVENIKAQQAVLEVLQKIRKKREEKEESK